MQPALVTPLNANVRPQRSSAEKIGGGYGGKNRIQAAIIIAAASFVTPAFAVNKCTTKNGKTVYQDAACDNSSAEAQSVKTWDNAPGSYGAGQKNIEPSETLEGPPQLLALLQIYRRWIDAEKLAASTARIAAATPVASLQAIYREAESIVVAPCALDSKRALVALTKQSVDSMLQFMQKQALAGMVYQILDRPKFITGFGQSIRSTTCKA